MAVISASRCGKFMSVTTLLYMVTVPPICRLRVRPPICCRSIKKRPRHLLLGRIGFHTLIRGTTQIDGVRRPLTQAIADLPALYRERPGRLTRMLSGGLTPG